MTYLYYTLWLISGAFFSYKYIKVTDKINANLWGSPEKLSTFDKIFIVLTSIGGLFNIGSWLIMIICYQKTIQNYNREHMKSLSLNEKRKMKLKKLKIKSLWTR